MEEHKKKKNRKVHLILICWLAFFCIFVLLLLYKPHGFKCGASIEGRQVSPYLTHILYPQLYNGAQSEEPFETTVLQEGINDIIARFNWPIQNNGIEYLTPQVFFRPGRIVLVGTVIGGRVKLLVTIVGRPAIDKDGFLNLNVVKVKIGAVNITVPAKIIAERIYKYHLDTTDVDTNNIKTKIAWSLVNNEPFEPIFSINSKKIRLKRVDITNGELKLHFVPVF